MKKIILIVVLFSVQLVSAQNKIKINISESSIKWYGSSLFNFNKHFGLVQFSKGSLIKDKDSIVGGDFEIDMNTIINTDGKYNEDLVSHLKGSDFFDTKQYPTAKLEIINVKYIDNKALKIKAILTIKKIAQTIEYNSTLENRGDNIVLKSKFILDRTLWNINYESKGFSDNVKDAIISDAMEFDITIITK